MDDPRGSAELAELDELELLRRRAYGPDADIAEDPAALARLSELEAAQRRRTFAVDDASERALSTKRLSVPEGGPGSQPGSAPIAEAATDAANRRENRDVAEHVRPEEPLAASATGRAPAEQWWRRHRVVILAGALAALSLDVAGVAWMSQLLADIATPLRAETDVATMPPLPPGQGYGSYIPTPDTVLGLRSVGDELDRPPDHYGTLDKFGISVDELRRYENFQGFNIWSGRSRHGVTCLFVAVPVQGLRDGLSGEGCSLNRHDATVDLPAMYGGDKLIRFVLRGERVNVYVYETGADPNSSHG
ncbi:hypothetical protein ACFC1I_11390 [Microbacterium sp. NPDC056044]|uniref:hypothetical protein n=1 Tax=Microbacterium sp. NPDC056044 TaxID=3345690 RepID=UPI0035DA9383